ncbi:MAG: radical SAM protein, partial [Nanoarchaeota archaeon]|nr:radical SAM protein [Nanoarchaeota archaeon]
MSFTILDCYTDEAAGLGVPPYLGTYPRYIYGMLKSKGHDPKYITIDDLRLLVHYKGVIKEVTEKDKTNIRIYNLTRNNVKEVLENTETLVVILGVHVPGKYLSAIPGTLDEVTGLLAGIKCKKILTGPAIFGTQLEGGKSFEKTDMTGYESKNFGFEFGGFDGLQEYAVKGAEILRHIPDIRIAEIETGRGCNIGRCSFCTEP